MSSRDLADALQLDRDLPTTAEDIAVLRRLRYGPRLQFDDYLRCLAALDPPSPDWLRRRPGPSGAPFDLIS